MRNEEQSNEEFDPTLARALKRVDAPKDFAARVMAAAEAQPKVKVQMFPKQRAWNQRTWMSGAIAAVLVLGVSVGVHVDHEREQRREIAQTQRQFDDAMRVTNRALDETRERLAKAGLGASE